MDAVLDANERRDICVGGAFLPDPLRVKRMIPVNELGRVDLVRDR